MAELALELFSEKETESGPAVSVINRWHQSGMAQRKIRVGAVTNMTIYSPKIVTLCQEGLTFSISVDGPKEIHDRKRTFRNGRGSFDRILKTYARYSDHGIQAASVDVVYTVEHLLAGFTFETLSDYLKEAFAVREIVINPYFSPSSDLDELEFADAVRKMAQEYLYSEYLKYGARSAVVRGVLSRLTGSPGNVGWCAAGDSTVSVMADGTILPCYTVATDVPQWTVCKVSDLTSRGSRIPVLVRHELDTANPRMLAVCSDCAIKDVCWGCPGGTFADTGQFSDRISWRCALRMASIEGVLEAKLGAHSV